MARTHNEVAQAGIEPTRRIRPPTTLTRVAKNLYRRQTGKHAWWILLYRSPVTRRRVQMSLGSVELMNRTEAKKAVLGYRVAILAGRCPLLERRAEHAARKPQRAQVPLFRAALDLYLAAHAKGRGRKNRVQWTNSLTEYAFPVLAELPVNKIGTAKVMLVLERIDGAGQPFWHRTPETASRVRMRIEAVLDYCAARHWCEGANPARWKGHLDKLLPAPGKVRPEQHFAALPWQELPALYQKLATQADASALALRYVLLTLLRTGEALGTPAEGEIDRDTKTHVLPPERMKARKEHRVPLTTEALAVLDQAEALRTGNTIFCGARGGQLSDMALLMKLRGLFPNRKVTTHGMRSAFRDWCSEHGIPRELAERQLAHTVRDATEAAYLRTDALDPRRQLMQRWADFLLAPVVPASEKVTSIDHERRRRAE